MPQEYSIESIEQLIAVLENFKDQDIKWYRGQADKNWKLTPNLLRRKATTSEKTIVNRFMQNASMLLGNKPTSYFDWLFLMQHYGVPTRLLDWSESPLVALYFAVSNELDSDGALWILDPIKLNALANVKRDGELDFIPSFEDKYLTTFTFQSMEEAPHIEMRPLATIATRNNVRIQAQQGVFTIHQLDKTPIDELYSGQHVTKINITKESKKKISDDLKLLGFSSFQLFPELASIGELVSGAIKYELH
ncbi:MULTISPECIES: FRG domain-containing protein [unclassified Acinetobacter]|uniref:FRG domain-containing protein n=1 Tax=unclassified Acinetobacter TaxID=196816 RepID=UPI0015D1F05E|nr:MULTISPECIES: FRG domain-containing protein [unclassified Acinetobacter]UIJ76402.1 FRG domain-containing protein [Acinetobacter sp. SH20PTE14]